MADTQLRRDGKLQFADSRKRPVDLLSGLSGLFGNLNSKIMAKQRTVYCKWANLKGTSRATKYVFSIP